MSKLTAKEFICTQERQRKQAQEIGYATIPEASKESLMIEFAKYHVQAALVEASKQAEIKVNVAKGYQAANSFTTDRIEYHENCGGSKYYTDNIATIDKSSILNAYSLDKIV